MNEQIFISIAYTVILLCILFLTEILRKYFHKFKEIPRKIAHILCGMTALSFPYFIQSHWIVFSLAIIFSLFMFVTKRKRLLKSIHEIRKKSYGDFYYPLAIYFIFLLASTQPVIYLISILTMTISDALAALIGQKYGTIKYEVDENTKTIEGSVAFFLITSLCIYFPLSLMTDMRLPHIIFITLSIAPIVTGFEAISPAGSDNILIPLSTYFLLSKMLQLPMDLVIQDLYIVFIVISGTIFLYRLKPKMLKPTGFVEIMLINYVAFILGNIYWLIPLLLIEMLFSIFITLLSKKPKEKYFLPFYMGIIPLVCIFLSTIFTSGTLIFIPYLVSIAAQFPLSYQFIKFKSNQGIYFILSILFIGIPSIIFYFGNLNLITLSVIITLVLIIYTLNDLFYKLTHGPKYEKKVSYLRFISTTLGTIIAFFVTYYL